MKELPLIACTLEEPQRGRRVEEWRALVDSATAYSRTAVGAALRFKPEDAVRARELAKAESECCAFLKFEFGEDSGETTMMIRAPLEAASLVHELLG